MRLTGLEVENVKRVRLVQLELGDESVVRIRGENEAGKSSFLDALQCLLGGAKTHPPKVIREGAAEAQVVATTDELVITRHWWKDEHGKECTELEVKALDGSPLKAPQAILDKLFADNALLPEAYSELESKRQLETLRKLVGVDTSKLDLEHEQLYASRTVENKKLEELKGRLTGMLQKEPAPLVDVAALLKQRGELTNLQQWAKQSAAERDAAMRRVSDAQEALKAAEAAANAARHKLEAVMKAAAEADNAVDAAEEAAEGCDEQLAAVSTQIQSATALAAEHERWKERQRTKTELDAKQMLVDGQTGRLEALLQQKEEMVASAKFPVEGLGFGTAGVMYKGLPLEQASSAAQLRVSVGIARAMNPKLRVLLIRKGSLLDKKALGELERICEEQDFQAFVELVGEDGPATVVIRDGQVAAAAGRAA